MAWSFMRLPACALALACAAPSVRAELPAAGAALPRWTLEHCVTTALSDNLEVRLAAEDQSLAEGQRGSARGQFGPKLSADASYQRWNEPYVFQGFPVHEISQWTVSATITQPITALFGIYHAFKVRDLGVDVAAVRGEAVRRQTAFRVVESYYKLLQAERLLEVAGTSVDQLNAQLRRAQSFHDNGTVSQDDVLRARLAVANADQRRIAGQARVTLERVRLAMLMGLPADTAVEAENPSGDRLLVREATTLDEAERVAEAERMELREIDKRIELTQHDKRVAYARLLPQVNLVGSYIHNVGSPFQPPDSAWVGAAASWDLWDRGATLGSISEAKVRARQAMIARQRVDQQIRFEVTQAYLDVSTAAQALGVADAAVAAAEENFRLVDKRYAASVATSFDVVDAEGLLTQARGQKQTALYDYVIARAALHTAMGAKPETLAQD
jgi:outer membrane protein